jgi:hypothetical protein
MDKHEQKKNHYDNQNENLYNCSLEGDSFILCMKKKPLIPTNDKCKTLFDIWYKCNNQEQFINEIKTPPL